MDNRQEEDAASLQKGVGLVGVDLQVQGEHIGQRMRLERVEEGEQIRQQAGTELPQQTRVAQSWWICDLKGEVPPASSLAPVLANQYPTHNHIVCVALLHTGDAVVVPPASRGVDTVVLGNGEAPTGTDAGRGIEAPAIEEWLIGGEKMHWLDKDGRQTACVAVSAVQSSQGTSRARGRELQRKGTSHT